MSAAVRAVRKRVRDDVLTVWTGRKKTFASKASCNDEAVDRWVGQARAAGGAAEISSVRMIGVASLVVVCAVGEGVVMRAGLVRVVESCLLAVDVEVRARNWLRDSFAVGRVNKAPVG